MALKTKMKTTREASEQKKQSLKEVQTEELARLNVNIPKSVHQKLKSKAAIDGTSINSLVSKWVKEYLSK